MHHTHIDAKIDQIVIGNRARQDFGDIDGLVESIKSVGLLQPIVITLKNSEIWLIDGHRRILAFQKLGLKEIPAVYLRLDAESLQSEYDANMVRKQFVPSEAVALAEKIKTWLSTKAIMGSLNKGGNLPPDTKDEKTRDKVAKSVGMSYKTLEKAKVVVESAAENPENADLVEKMDQTGKVDTAYRELQERKGVKIPPDNSYTSKEIDEIAKDTKSPITSLIVKMPDGRQKKMGSIAANWYENRNILCWIIGNVGLGVDEKDIVTFGASL